MRKTIIFLLLLSFCSSGSDSTSNEPTNSAAASSIEELIYEDENGNLVNEDLTNKKTLCLLYTSDAADE